MSLVVKEDSYARRRQVFRDIWVAPLQKESRPKKPKVIRTARLSSDLKARYNCMKMKNKQDIKHLKTACDKMLDNETEAMFFDQLTANHPLREMKPKKKKKRIRRKKKNEIQLHQASAMSFKDVQNFSKTPLRIMRLKAFKENEKCGTADAIAAEVKTMRRLRVIKPKRGKIKKKKSM